MDYEFAAGQSASTKSDGGLEEARAAEQSPEVVNAAERGGIETAERTAMGEKVLSAAGAAMGAATTFNFTGRGRALLPAPRVGLRKYGPIGLIITLVAICVGLVAGSQAMAPFSLVANALDQFNGLRTSMNKRSTYFMRFAMDPERNTSITKAKIFGGEKFAIGKKIQGKMAQNGIDYFEGTGTDGRKIRVLVYNDPDSGGRIPIVADEADLGRIPTGELEVEGKQLFGAMTLDKALELGDALEFKQALDVSTRTMKGHIAGWFDTVSANFMKRINNTRNRYSGIGDEASDEDVQAASRKAGLEVGAEKSKGKVTEDEVETDEDGNRKVISSTEVGDDGLKAKMNEQEVETSLTNRMKKAVAGVDTTIVNLVCQFSKVTSMINQAARAIKVAQTLNFVTSVLEAIDRVKLGEGNSAAMNYFMEGMSKRGDTVLKEGDTEVVLRENTSTWESPALGQLYGDKAVSSDDPVAQKHNTDGAIATGLKANGAWWGVAELAQSVADAGGSVTGWRVCATTQAFSSLLGLVQDIAKYRHVVEAATGPVGWIVGAVDLTASLIIEAVTKAGPSLALQTATTLFVKFVAPSIAQWLAMDLISNMAGEDAAYAMMSGFNMYMGRQLQSSSGIPGNKKQVIAQYRLTQEVIAEEAELERQTLSPFDASSKNTFLGSILNSLTPMAMALKSSSVMTAVTSGLTTVGSSLSALMPSVDAITDEVSYSVSLNEDCPYLSSVGLVGDAYCNPYFVSDYSTISEDPYEVFNKVGDENFVDVNAENPQIKEGSELSKWAVACSARSSEFGYVDPGIASFSYTGDGDMDNLLSMGINMVPVVNEVLDLNELAANTKNLGWSSGENCMKEEYKYFSRYSEDQRQMEAMGVIDKSAVTAFLEEYQEKNPIDNSLEGVLAQYGGLTEEEVDTVLGLVEYESYLANYDPEGRLPAEPVARTEISFVDTEGVELPAGAGMVAVDGSGAVAARVMYQDLRMVETVA